MSDDRSTFKHAAVYSAAAMLSRIIGFLLLPLYAHELQAIGYGIIALIDTAMNFMLSLLGQGIRGGLVRFYHEEPDPEAKKRVVVTGSLLVGAASVVMSGLTMLLSKPLSSLLFGEPTYWAVVCLGAGAFIFSITAETASTLLIIQRRSFQFSMVSLLQLTAGLLFNVLFIIVLRMGIIGFFLASIITAAMAFLAYGWLLVRSCGWGFDREVARKIIAFQTPLVPGALASFASRQVERVLVRAIQAIESVGVLEMGYKFPVLLTLLIQQPFMRSWDTRRVEIAEEPDGPQRIGRMFTYGLFLMLAAGLVMAVCIRDLLMILTPPEFWEAHRIAKIEIVTVILQSCMYHLIFGIFYHKKTGQWAKVRGVTSAVKVGMSVLFISLWGLYGAAYSACATMIITMIWGGRIGMGLYRFDIEKAKVTAMVVTAVVLYVLLDRADMASWATLDAARDVWLPGLANALQSTFLGTWKDGKAVIMLLERKDLIVDMAARGLLASSFVLLLPAVHDPTRRKAVGKLRRRPAAV
ncbi:MAG TPA: oligosaccharide flippase family protein [Candidatus Krumholzibacteria bacterium]|nr:oligosaccharide flippase family protein [Candidatus Krumholzibacteria bacterium]HRX51376.1 oligosaccharide flippase family protein [Candidatus Krumholzibacteria bacterium]